MTKYYECVGNTHKLVILSEVEGSPADWLWSLYCVEDEEETLKDKTKNPN
jgi:hypothetical protein